MLPETSFTKLRLLIITAFVSFIVLSSCTPQSRLSYMQTKHSLGDELNVNIGEYMLKPGDILHVRIMSSDQEADAIFNLEDNTRTVARNVAVGDPQMFLYGYSINARGEIQLPVIGTIKVSGLSIDSAHSLIQERAAEYIIDATVAVKIVNFSVTVLGEVRAPGTFYVYDHEFTVLGALGAAGDLTDYGNRNIHLVRRTDDGLSFHRLDITDRRSVTSELYYLQPNDIIYVEPLLAKRFGFATFPFGVFFSAITTTLLLISYFK
ncbi:MAG: polysaccharide biosynthesis/export family protein [Bacteroidales bacterium]